MEPVQVITDSSSHSSLQEEYNGSCLVLDDKMLPSLSIHDRNQAVYWTMIIVNMALIVVAIVLGIPGNILNAAVFYRQGLRERINLCLFALAIVNLIVLISLLMTAMEDLYRQTLGPAWVVSPFAYCLRGAVWASQFLSAVIASERCFCVVSPFHAKRLLKTSTMAAIIVVCSLLLTGGMNTVVCPKFHSVCIFDPSTKVVEEAIYVTKYYQDNKRILDIIDIFFYSTALQGFFLVVIVITTCITAIKLRAAVAWRLTVVFKVTSESATTATPPEADRKEVSVTLMLMATSVLFTVCITANIVVQIARVVVPGFESHFIYPSIISSLWRIVFLLWTLNSSMNVAVYYKMGSKFRDMVRYMLGRKSSRTNIH